MRILKDKYISKASLERFDDACFSLLMESYAARLGEKYMEESRRLNAEGAEFPESLDKKCRGIIRRTLAQKRRRKFRAGARKYLRSVAVGAASALLVLALSSALLFSTVEAFRTQVVNSALSILDTGKGSIVTVVRGGEGCEDLRPGYLPEGYELSEDAVSGEARMLKYSNGSAGIRFSRVPLGSMAIDSEGAELTETSICGHEALFISREDGDVLCWFDYEAESAYTLWADELGYEELRRIAESCYQ